MLNLRSDVAPTEDDLARWSRDNPGYRFESIGCETIVSPTGGKSALRNHRLNQILGNWADDHGYQAFGPSAGFVFGNLKVSPDEALLRAGRFEALSESEQERFIPLAPDVAVELISRSQRYGKTRRDVLPKCAAMFEAGVGYVVMLDAYAEVETNRVMSWGVAPSNFPTDWDAILDS